MELLAPNGKRSNLTPEQYKLVRTPEFKAWFGDWENSPETSSKVVDENGEPMVCYHGTRNRFFIFDRNKGGESNTLAKVGFWFTPKKIFAENFAEESWWGKNDAIVYSFFLDIKNPKIYVTDEIKTFGDSYEKFRTDIYKIAGQSEFDANVGGLGMQLKKANETIDKYRELLSDEGYDGIFINKTRFDRFQAGGVNNQIIALYPNQIKLADGTNTTFDSNNPDIRYADGGEIKKLKQKIKDLDNWFYNNTYGTAGYKFWDEKAAEAESVRRRLYELTGDAYGETQKEKEKRKEKPSDRLLNAEYNHPSELPKKVYEYISLKGNLLTDDATDAVRWSRIIGTENDDRYPRGEMTIYRAVKFGDYIREGDWVTTDEGYANQHNDMYFEGKGKILEESVDGSDVLFSPTGNKEEAIYAPMEFSKPFNYYKKKFEIGGEVPDEIPEGAKLLPLTMGKFAIVDAEDFDWLNEYKWRTGVDRSRDGKIVNYYGQRTIYLGGKTPNTKANTKQGSRYQQVVTLGKQIMGIPLNRDLRVDYIDGNKLNNQKSNLRVATISQINYGATSPRDKKKITSKYIGVSYRFVPEKKIYDKRRNTYYIRNATGYWRVTIQDSMGRRYDKNFPYTDVGEIKAAKWYDSMAKLIHGEFAVLNFPDEYEAGGRTKKNKLKGGGDCYYVAGQFAMGNLSPKKINYIGTPYIVHAEVQGQGDISNIRYGHAFVEDDVLVYDFSNNREIIIPKQIYYSIGDIDVSNPSKYRKYTFQEARKKMVETGNYGCWDLDVEYSKGGNISSTYIGNCIDVDSGKKEVCKYFPDATVLAQYVGNPDEDEWGKSKQITQEQFYKYVDRYEVPKKSIKGNHTYHYIADDSLGQELSMDEAGIFFIYNQDSDIHYFFKIRQYSKGGITEEDKKETYKRWKDLVNMSASELKRFMDSEEGKIAGLSKKEADKLGIHYGRESAKWILKMKDTPVKEWTPTMWEWAKRQISFNSRMRGNKGKLYDEKGRKTRKHLSLLIWGHNPEKYESGGEIFSVNNPEYKDAFLDRGDEDRQTWEDYGKQSIKFIIDEIKELEFPLTIYRGVAEKYSETPSKFVENRSWTTEIDVAKRFAGGLGSIVSKIVEADDIDYESTIKRRILHKSLDEYEIILNEKGEKIKPKFIQESKFYNGGEITLTTEQVENILGRKISAWDDSVVMIGNVKYKKMYLLSQYKKV